MHAKDGQLTISSIFRILVSENYEEKKKKEHQVPIADIHASMQFHASNMVFITL